MITVKFHPTSSNSKGSMIDSLFKVDGQFPCPKCEKSYVHLRNLHRHLKNECGIEPSYQCPWCPKKCRYNFTLKSHIYVNYYYWGNTKKNGSDDNVTRNVCPQCGRTYRHKTTMLTHIKYECNKEPQFVCKFCGKCIYYPSNFKKHLILKHGYMIA